jgi:hypothetical protein
LEKNDRAFIATTVVEKISALMTDDYLRERAALGSRDKLRTVLAECRTSSPTSTTASERSAVCPRRKHRPAPSPARACFVW